MMYATIKKWGNSLALRIPQSFAAQLGVEENSNVSIEISDNQLIIKRGQTLEDMLEGINDENKHNLMDLSEPRGKELI